MARIKLDADLERTLNELHAKVDSILNKVKETTDTVQNFDSEFIYKLEGLKDSVKS
jgi:hypothetical protein